MVFVQLQSSVPVFATPWTAAGQPSLPFTISWSLLKITSFATVMLSNHLILCHPPSPFAFHLSHHQGLFQWVGFSHQVAKYWSFSFSISPFNKYSGLISFRVDWFDFLGVKRLSRVFFKSTTIQKIQFFMVHDSKDSILYGPETRQKQC